MKNDITTHGEDRQMVPVEWRECAWQPGIKKFQVASSRLQAFRPEFIIDSLRFMIGKPLPKESRAGSRRLLQNEKAARGYARPTTNRSRFPIYFKTMKTHLPSSRRTRSGFTLIELLTVIGIIAILASMLLVVLNVAQTHAKVVEAETQEQDLVNAIQKYDSDYGRFPVSSQAQAAANPDFTYGGTFTISGGTMQVGNTTGSQAYFRTNDEVMAILMDITNYPNTTTATVNTNYQKNPQQNIYLQLHMNSDSNPTLDNPPGLGQDLVYRDPWGHPYVISMDLNYDEMCEDAFYRLGTVSSNNAYGLIQNPGDAANAPNNWAYRGKVMVWSAGPNGTIDPTDPSTDYENKDNVLSWK